MTKDLVVKKQKRNKDRNGNDLLILMTEWVMAPKESAGKTKSGLFHLHSC